MDGAMKRRLLGMPARRSSVESTSAQGEARPIATGMAARTREQARSEVRSKTVGVSPSHRVERCDLREEPGRPGVRGSGDARDGGDESHNGAAKDASRAEVDMEAPSLSAFAFSPRHIEEAQLQELRHRPPVAFVVHNAAGDSVKRATSEGPTAARAAERAMRPSGKRQSWNSPVHVPLAHRKLVQTPAIFSDDPPFGQIAPRPPPSLGSTKHPKPLRGSASKAQTFRGTRTLEKLELRQAEQTDFREQMGNGAFMQALRERNVVLFNRLVLRFERLKRTRMQLGVAREDDSGGGKMLVNPAASRNYAEVPITSEFSGVEDAILFFLEAKHRHDVLYFKRKGGNKASQEPASRSGSSQLSLGLSSASASSARYLPYDLERIEESPRQGKGDYFIMTQASIVHHSNNADADDGAGEVIPVSQWVLESKMFSLLLAGIPLFQKFLLRKVFMGWLSAIRQFMYRDNRKAIAQSLPFARPSFVQPMLQSCRILHDIQTIRSLVLPIVRLAVDLVAVQEHHKELLALTESKLIDAKEELLVLMDHMVHSICEDLEPPTNLDELYNAEASFVHVVDAKWKSAPIAALHLRKVDLKRQRDEAQLDMGLVGKYIRMMDYMFTGSLYLMVVDCVRNLSSELSDEGNLGVICATVTIAGNSLELSPSLEETQYVFHDSIARVIRLVSNFHFSKNAMTWSSNRGTGALAAVAKSFVSSAIKRQIKLQELLRTDPVFDQVTKELDCELAHWFHEAAHQMLAFDSLRPIYAEVQSVRRYDPSKAQAGGQITTSTVSPHPPVNLSRLTKISGGDLVRYLKRLDTRLAILDRSQHACQKLQSSWKVGLLEIQCRRSISDIMDLITHERAALHETLYQLCISGIAECISALQRATLVFEDRPQLIEYFCEQMKQVRLLKDGERELNQDIRNVDDAVRALKRFAPSLGSEASPQYNVMHQLFGKYTVLHQAHAKFAAKVLPSITYQVNTALQKYSQRCQKLLRMHDDFAGMSAEADMEKNITMFQEVARELAAIEKATKLYQEYKKMVGLKAVEIPLLGEAMSKWGEVQELIKFTIQWRTTINSMENGIFAEQNWAFHTDKVHNFLPMIRDLQSRERAGFAEKMLESIHLAVVDYLRKLSLVREMAQPWVKAHHWKEILMLMDILNFVSSIGVLITDGTTVTLGFLRSRDLWRFETQIREITRKAHHDDVTEKMLNAMKARLQDAALPISRSRDSYELDIPRANLLLESLEDDLLTIQSLAQVTASSALQLQLVQWGEEVRHCEEVLDKWRGIQCDRTKLGSLFALRDVQQSVTDATFEFQAVDRKWKGMMHAAKSASTLSICLREVVTLAFLIGAQDSYEKLWLHLGGYIEEKRRYFPRFNFISDRDLIQLLVFARDPKNLPRMISKCFREIHSLRVPSTASNAVPIAGNATHPPQEQSDKDVGVAHGPTSQEYGEHHESLLPSRTQHAVFDIDAIYGAPPGEFLAIKPLRVNASPEVWMKEFEERVLDAVASAVCSIMDGSLVTMFEDNFEMLRKHRSVVVKQDLELSNGAGEQGANDDASVDASQTGAWDGQTTGHLWEGSPLQIILLCMNILVTHDISPLARVDRSGAGWQRFWQMFHRKKANLIAFIKRGDCNARERWIAGCILTLLLNKSRGIRELYDDQPLAIIPPSAAPMAGSDASIYHYSYAASESFTWTKLPRFYYEPFEKKCTIHQCVKTFEYGYSFLGSYACPVLSPVCDRAVLAMSTALSLENGVLLHSASSKGSTGKRTLTRELAAMVGRECMGFDCSSGITFAHMKRVLRGMLQCNALWFSFSGLETSSMPQMLRVFAQEMHRVMDALRGRQDMFSLDGTPVEISNTNLAVVVTCSLDYHFAPHQQVLLRLSNSFVPVSCTHADSELIMETLMFVNGFQDWRTLSEKLERLFSLLIHDPVPFTKDLLASRLPLVFAISRGMTKRLASDTWKSAERCVVAALWEEINTKIIPDRRVAFLKCLRAVFPLAEDLEINALGMLTLRAPMEIAVGVRHSLKYDEDGQVPARTSTEESYDSDEEEQHSKLKAVKAKLESTMHARQLCVSEFYVRKLLELYQVVSRRVVTVVAGRGVCGKSSALSILSTTFAADLPADTRTQSSSIILDSRIKIVRLYPEAFELSDIYGEFKGNDGWDDGFFSHFFRQNCAEPTLNNAGSISEAVAEKSGVCNVAHNAPISRQESFYSKVQGASAVPPPSSTLHPASWMVFDGVCDAATLLEPLRGLAEASPADIKRMALPNGDQLHCYREHLRIFCEVESLQQWSPACLSRCGLVYMQADHILPYTLLIKSWSQQQLQQKYDVTSELSHPLTISREVVDLVAKLMRCHLPALLDVCKRHPTGFLEFSVGHVVANMLQMVTLFVVEVSKGVEEESDQWMSEARIAVAYAATISLGMVLSTRGRAEFHLAAMKIAPQLQDEHPLFVSSPATTLFDVGLRFQAHRVVLFRWTSVLSEGARLSNHKNSFVYQTEVPRRTSALLRAKGRLVSVEEDDDADGDEGLFVGDTSSLTSALSTIYVPTPQTVSCRAWLKMLVSAKANGFVVGESGIGKTLVLENCLRELGQRERVSALNLQVRPSMRGHDIQRTIENGMAGKLKGAYCPGVGKRALVLLLENLNLETQVVLAVEAAKSEVVGPCSAMIRQVTDGKGSFVKASKEFVEFKDLTIWCSFSLSTLGYPRLTSRLLRHFHVIWLPDQCDQVFKQVLPTFSVHFMKRYEPSFGNFGSAVKRVCQFPIKMFKVARKTWKSSLVAPHLLFNVGDVLSVFISLMNVSVTSTMSEPETEFERLTLFFTLQLLRNKLLHGSERVHLNSLAHDIATKLKFSSESVACISSPEEHLFADCGETEGYTRVGSRSLMTLFVAGEERFHWYHKSNFRARTASSDHSSLSRLGSPNSRASMGTGRGRRATRLSLALSTTGSVSEDVRVEVPSSQETIVRRSSLAMLALKSGATDEKVAVTSSALQLQNMLDVYSFLQSGARHLLVSGSDTADRRSTTMIACGALSFQFREVGAQIRPNEFVEQVKMIVMEAGLRATLTVLYVEYDHLEAAELSVLAHLIRHDDLGSHLYSSADKVSIHAFDHQSRGQPVVPSPASRSSFLHAVATSSTEKGNTWSRASPASYQRSVYRENVRRSLYIALSFGCAGKLFDFMTRFPSVYYRFVSKTFPSWQEGSADAICNTALHDWAPLEDIAALQDVAESVARATSNAETCAADCRARDQLRKLILVVYRTATGLTGEYRFGSDIALLSPSMCGRTYGAVSTRLDDVLRVFKILFAFHSKKLEGQHYDLEKALRFLKKKLSQTNLRVAREETSEVLQSGASQAVASSGARLKEQEAAEREARRSFLLDEECCARMQNDIEIERASIQTELAKTLPDVQEATEALSQINKHHIVEMKSFTNPPQLVRLAMQAVCVLLGVPPTWSEALRILADIRFLERLRDFDRDRIDPSLIERVKFYVNHPDFSMENMRRASLASTTLCKWVLALVRYFEAMKRVAPTQRQLEEAQSNFRVIEDRVLAEKKKLVDIEVQLSELRTLHARNLQREENFQRTQETRLRWKAAITRFAGVVKHWHDITRERLECLEQRQASLLGDCTILAALIVLGTEKGHEDRTALMCQWRGEIHRHFDEVGSRNPFPLTSDISTLLQHWSLSGEGLAPHLHQVIMGMRDEEDEAFATSLFLMEQVRQVCFKIPLLLDPLSRSAAWVKQAYRGRGNDGSPSKPSSRNEASHSTGGCGSGQRPQEDADSVLALDAGDPFLIHSIEKCIAQTPPSMIIVENAGEGDEEIIEEALVLFTLLKKKSDCAVYFATKSLTKTVTWKPKTWNHFAVVNFTPTPQELDMQFLSLFYRQCTSQTTLQSDVELLKPKLRDAQGEEEILFHAFISSLCTASDEAAIVSRTATPVATAASVVSAWISYGSGRQEFQDEDAMDRISAQLDEFLAVQTVRGQLQQHLHRLHEERREARVFLRYTRAFTVAEGAVAELDPLLSLPLPQMLLNISECLEKSLTSLHSGTEDGDDTKGSGLDDQAQELAAPPSSVGILAAQMAELIAIHYIRERLAGLPSALHRTYLLVSALSFGETSGDNGEGLENATRQLLTESMRARLLRVCSTRHLSCQFSEWSYDTSESHRLGIIKHTAQDFVGQTMELALSLSTYNSRESRMGNLQAHQGLDSDLLAALSKIEQAFALSAVQNVAEDSRSALLQALYEDMTMHSETWKAYLCLIPPEYETIGGDENIASASTAEDAVSRPPWVEEHLGRLEHILVHVCLFGWISTRMLDDFIVSHLGEQLVSQVVDAERPTVAALAQRSTPSTPVLLLSDPSKNAAAASSSVRRCAPPNGIPANNVTCASVGYGMMPTPEAGDYSTNGDDDVAGRPAKRIKDQAETPTWTVIEDAMSTSSLRFTNALRHQILLLQDPKIQLNQKFRLWLLQEMAIGSRFETPSTPEMNLSKLVDLQAPLFPVQRMFLETPQTLRQLHDSCIQEEQDQMNKEMQTRRDGSQGPRPDVPPMVHRPSTGLTPSHFQHGSAEHRRIRAALWLFHALFRLHVDDARCFSSEGTTSYPRALPVDLCISHCELERTMRLLQLHMHQHLIAATVTSGVSAATAQPALASAGAKDQGRVLTELVALVYMGRQWGDARAAQCRDILSWCFYPEALGLTSIEHDAPLKIRLLHLRDKLATSTMGRHRNMGDQVELGVTPSSVRWRHRSGEASRVVHDLARIYHAPLLLPLRRHASTSMNASAMVACLRVAQRRLQDLMIIFPDRTSLSSGVQQLKKQRRESMVGAWGARRRASAAAVGWDTPVQRPSGQSRDAIRERFLPLRSLSSPQWQQQQPAAHLNRVELPAMETYLNCVWKSAEAVLALRCDSAAILEAEMVDTLKALSHGDLPPRWRGGTTDSKLVGYGDEYPTPSRLGQWIRWFQQAVTFYREVQQNAGLTTPVIGSAIWLPAVQRPKALLVSFCHSVALTKNLPFKDVSLMAVAEQPTTSTTSMAVPDEDLIASIVLSGLFLSNAGWSLDSHVLTETIESSTPRSGSLGTPVSPPSATSQPLPPLRVYATTRFRRAHEDDMELTGGGDEITLPLSDSGHRQTITTRGFYRCPLYTSPDQLTALEDPLAYISLPVQGSQGSVDVMTVNGVALFVLEER